MQFISWLSNEGVLLICFPERTEARAFVTAFDYQGGPGSPLLFSLWRIVGEPHRSFADARLFLTVQSCQYDAGKSTLSCLMGGYIHANSCFATSCQCVNLCQVAIATLKCIEKNQLSFVDLCRPYPLLWLIDKHYDIFSNRQRSPHFSFPVICASAAWKCVTLCVICSICCCFW